MNATIQKAGNNMYIVCKEHLGKSFVLREKPFLSRQQAEQAATKANGEQPWWPVHSALEVADLVARAWLCRANCHMKGQDCPWRHGQFNQECHMTTAAETARNVAHVQEATEQPDLFWVFAVIEDRLYYYHKLLSTEQANKLVGRVRMASHLTRKHMDSSPHWEFGGFDEDN